jgi:hypothetical protein
MMDSDQIARSVGFIVDGFLDKGTKLLASDKMMLLASRDLFINVLQNLNDIAHSLREIEERGRPNQ